MEPTQGQVVPERIKAHPIDIDMLRYQRQTRNATVTIAWVVCILTALSIIGGIVGAVQLAKISNSVVTTCDSTIEYCP
jgi:hypothetical protein